MGIPLLPSAAEKPVSTTNMSITTPVSHDRFHYFSGDLYVEVTGRNRHRRATVHELQELFHPSRTSTVPPRDPPAHWYEAQLIHYGIPSSKVKGTAVKRLLDAVNTGSLYVPQTIQGIEQSLKRQWDDSGREARKQPEHAATKSSPKSSKNQGRKRKTEAVQSRSDLSASNGVNFSININMGSMGSQGFGSSDKRKRMAETSEAEPILEYQCARKADMSVPLLDSRITNRTTSKLGSTFTAEASTKAAPMGKEEAKTKVKSESVVEYKRSPEPVVEYERSPEPKIKENRNYSPISQPRFFSNDQPSRWSTPSYPVLGLVNGIYGISCPYVTSGWNCEDLTITISYDTQSIWSAFDFGMFYGVFHCNHKPCLNEQLSLRWRGYRHLEDDRRVRDNHCGWISFLGHGRIEGSFEILGDFDFEGEIVESGTKRPAYDIKDEWDSNSLNTC